MTVPSRGDDPPNPPAPPPRRDDPPNPAAPPGGGMAEPTVLIADDQDLVRTGFRMILTARGITVVGEAADGAEALAQARRLRPDVVLMDIRMPNVDGLQATRRILQHVPDCRVIMLTTFDLDRYVYDALAAGASGFLLKDVTPAHLAAAVRLVGTGDALLAPSITRRLVEKFASGDRGRHPHTQAMHRELTGLTPREVEVLALMGRGLSNSELADALILSEATVKTHVARMFAKLALRDRAQAVVLAYETGLVVPEANADEQPGQVRKDAQ
jgi:DNA-binding NarL/FixJ family response regulator